MLTIKPVQNKKDWSQFIDFQWEIYKNDTIWVPNLKIAIRNMLDVNKNPFFKHSQMRAFLAEKDGKIVGRILGVIDDNHNRFHEEKTAFFGFFECIEDQTVSKKLFEAVEKWSKEKGMSTLRGPVNLSTNHECGLLVEGFEDSPYVMMSYNPKYYSNLIEKNGFAKSKDLFSWEVDAKKSQFSDRLMAQFERLKQKKGIVIRPISVKNFDKELEDLLDVYNDAWEKNWGFVPMEPEEFRHMGKDMKMVLDPRICLVLENKGEVVGFALALPDVNQVFKKLPNGKLLPFGLVKLLWNLKGPGRRKTVNRCRILTLGIKKSHRFAALGALFYSEFFNTAPKLGYRKGEASWILEDNTQMNKALEHMGGYKTKTYRIYDKSLN